MDRMGHAWIAWDMHGSHGTCMDIFRSLLMAQIIIFLLDVIILEKNLE